jgi:Uma2 family endonuclease
VAASCQLAEMAMARLAVLPTNGYSEIVFTFRDTIMIATIEPPVDRVLLHDVSWNTYESLLADAYANHSHVRFTYDEGDLEIMTLSFGHENIGRWIGRLIDELTMELDIPLRGGGSTTLRSSLRKKGLEADESFWIANELAMRGKDEWNVATDPPPDLVVEVDITNSSLNRFGIYAALRVPEIWHFDGSAFSVFVLSANEKYRRAAKSRAFPNLPIKPFAGFIRDVKTSNETALLKSFRRWLRKNVIERD